MIYLLLSILCSSTMSIVMRLSEGRVKYKSGMLAANYLACILMSICFIGPSRLFAAAEGMGTALGMGMFNGVLFVAAMLSSQYAISRIGVVLPSVFSRTGALLVPMAVSILLFGESPSSAQIAGAALAVTAILLMNLRGGEGAGSTSPLLLLVLLLTEGSASAMTKVYQSTGEVALSDHFLLFTYASAFVLCLILTFLRRERPALRELFCGMMIGVPNFLAAKFVLGALGSLQAIIVYPCRSAGSIALITLSGVLLFRERLNRRQIIALPIILAALVLLNL